LPWPVPGDEPGAGDGYYTFKAMAFTALGSQGNSWELTYRVETGPPAPVGNLVGTAGKTSASLTWTASPTADLDHYEVTRADPDGTIVTVAGDPDTPPKFLGLGFSELEGALTENSTYTYSVYAVDWMGNRSVAAQLTLTATELLTQPPLPATNLRGEVIGSSARLTWGASLTPTVVGYKVYVNGGATSAYTTSLATLDIDQGWGTTAWYQVKPYIAGDVVSTQWASLFPGSPSVPLGGVEWVKVVVGAEPRYTLNIGNTTNKALATLKLYYLGPLGAPQPAVPVPPDKTNVAKDAISTWTDLAAGQYRWDWVTSNGKAGSKTAPVSGSVLIINEGTP